MTQRVAILVARFNQEITDGLLAGAQDALAGAGLPADALTVLRVPGAFELPVTAMRLAESGRFDALVCLGCLIKGDTMHFEYIAEATAHGLMEVSVATGIPVAFGVLTTTTEQQAIERAAPGPENKGREAALAALEMAGLLAAIDAGGGAS
jgi:6,7-dimethyl-8-ribityllumazine synthase